MQKTIRFYTDFKAPGFIKLINIINLERAMRGPEKLPPGREGEWPVLPGWAIVEGEVAEKLLASHAARQLEQEIERAGGKADRLKLYEWAKERIKKDGVVEIPERIHYLWGIEFVTEGAVYSRVIGRKAWRFKINYIMNLIAGDTHYAEPISKEFEFAPLILSIEIPGEGRKIRKFWDYKGRIRIFADAQVFREKIIHKDGRKIKTASVKREKVELMRIEVYWLGHAAGEQKKLSKLIKKYRKRGRDPPEEIIIRWAEMPRHRKAKLLLIYKDRYGEELKREVVEAEAITRDEDKISFGSQTLIVKKDCGTLAGDGRIVQKIFKFEGERGPLHHEMIVARRPPRKIKVKAFILAKQRYLQNVLENRLAPPARVSEARLTNEKVWAIEPADEWTEIILKNKDHRKEALDRILIHLANGQKAIFIHNL